MAQQKHAAHTGLPTHAGPPSAAGMPAPGAMPTMGEAPTAGEMPAPGQMPTAGLAGPTPADAMAPNPSAWVGWVFFAGVIMFMIGCFNAIAGIVALVDEDYFMVPSSNLMVQADYNAWGWTLLAYGAVVGLAGIGVMLGQTWARVVAVVLAVINALVNLAFLPAYPIWTAIVITLDVVVIYALIVHGGEARVRTRPMPPGGAYPQMSR